MFLKCATSKHGLVGDCFYRGTTNVDPNFPPIVFLTFSDFVHVYGALCMYYSMHLVEYVILYQSVLCF